MTELNLDQVQSQIEAGEASEELLQEYGIDPQNFVTEVEGPAPKHGTEKLQSDLTYYEGLLKISTDQKLNKKYRAKIRDLKAKLGLPKTTKEPKPAKAPKTQKPATVTPAIEAKLANMATEIENLNQLLVDLQEEKGLISHNWEAETERAEQYLTRLKNLHTAIENLLDPSNKTLTKTQLKDLKSSLLTYNGTDYE